MQEDRRIKENVVKELDFDPLVEETGVGVAVTDGAVTLSGTVPSLPAKRRAIEAAHRVRGVRAVADDLEIRIPGDKSGMSDGDIAEKIAHVMEWNVALRSGSVEVTVEEGDVRLEGTVRSQAEKRLLDQQVGCVRGVRSVDDRTVVEAKGAPGAVADAIEAALHRRAALDARGIKVEVEGDRVILTGTVRDAAERRLIEDAVFNAPGIDVLEDRLVLE